MTSAMSSVSSSLAASGGAGASGGSPPAAAAAPAAAASAPPAPVPGGEGKPPAPTPAPAAPHVSARALEAYVSLSKGATRLLRWKGIEEGLKFRRDGYTPLGPVALKLRTSPAMLLEVVERGKADKARLSVMTEGGVQYIRANQGHGADFEGVIDPHLCFTPVRSEEVCALAPRRAACFGFDGRLGIGRT